MIGFNVQRLKRRLFANRKYRRAVSGRDANLSDIEAFIVKNVEPIRAPLMLISQAQRSGGTLLNQLLDGHPALADYPYEIRFSIDKSSQRFGFGPELDADGNFQLLFDRKVLGFLKGGFSKGVRDPNRHRFLMVPRLQHAVFAACFEAKTPVSRRDIMDYFFTSFFNAWLDYQGPLAGKRWVVAFAPRFVHVPERAGAVFDCYPDGRLIQIVRDPYSWFASAKLHRRSLRKGATPESLVALWRESAEAMRRNRHLYGDRVIILRFEDIVGRTEDTMRSLCHVLGINYDPILITPTFNGKPMRANSSFSVEAAGVISDPLNRVKTLEESERLLIEAGCKELHEEIARWALAPENQAATRQSAAASQDLEAQG